MTHEERENPSLLNGTRKLRISKGCGQDAATVNKLIKDFEMARKMMKEMMGGGKAGMMGAMRGGGGGGRTPVAGHGTGKGKSRKELKKKKKKSR
jgi:signal recognition particle subunit SRP54